MVGRHKKISFQCQYCDKIFKRKYHYEIHLLSHSTTSGQRRIARARSNWCHVCRKSFTPFEYKLHIMTEHQFDSHVKFIDVSENESDKSIDMEISNKKKKLSPIKNIKREVDKNDTAKSPRKTISKLSKNIQNDSTSPVIKIKSELYNKAVVISPKKGKKAQTRSLIIICDKCGIKCKNERGLKIHKSTIHKRNSFSKKLKTSPKDIMIQSDQPKQIQPKQTNQCINSAMSATNTQQLYFQGPPSSVSQNVQSQLIYNPFSIQSTHKRNTSHNKYEISSEDMKIQWDQPKPIFPELTNQCINYVTPITNNQQLYFQNPLSNLSQNAQPQLIFNPYPVQQPLFMNNTGGIVNQPNKPGTQVVPIFMNQNPEIEHIPTFSPDDEKYIKWLKNLIHRCKVHKYPLTPMLCKCLNHLNFEIADAMANPKGCMLRRSKQFYFKKIQTVISEIMLGQLRYSIHVVKR